MHDLQSSRPVLLASAPLPPATPTPTLFQSEVEVVLTGRRLFGQASCSVTVSQQSRRGNTLTLRWAEKKKRQCHPDPTRHGLLLQDWDNWRSRGERRVGWTKVGRHGKVVENVATDGQRVGNFGKVAESVATDGLKMKEKLCKSKMKDLVRTQSRERETCDVDGDG